MHRSIEKIVVVGGGTAGWITANVIAAEHVGPDSHVNVVLIESPDVPTIGVGEGTWPSLRTTLQKIGLPEIDVIRACDASFKQGTQFVDWSSVGAEPYIHPFSLPSEYTALNLAEYWVGQKAGGSFARFVTPQASAIEAGLAPKQLATPEYAFNLNYGYHFDAGKFAKLLHQHGVNNLGVQYVSANVLGVDSAASGDIEAVRLDSGERLQGDLFVDCTGHKGLLISGHFEVPFQSVKHCLFNDRAIAVQVPYANANDAVASVTRSTAVDAGWIWDIGLQTRRGVGFVHASDYCTPEEALLEVKKYVTTSSPGIDPEALSYRTLNFDPGYRERFWVKNCVAIGLSAGFVEPLEASAIALIEQSAAFVSQQLPANRQIMDVVAKKFNTRMTYHWGRIIEFLKLHYVLSQRDARYWQDNRCLDTCPVELQEKLTLWQQQAPWHDDAPRVDELFPSASYQYVLYGMHFQPKYQSHHRKNFRNMKNMADAVLQGTLEKSEQLKKALPSNRELLNQLSHPPINKNDNTQTGSRSAKI